MFFNFKLGIVVVVIAFYLQLQLAKCFDGSSTKLQIDPWKLKRAKVISRIDPEYCSVTIDSYQLYRHWKYFGIENKTLITLTKNLYPAYIRIGGNAGDAIVYVDREPTRDSDVNITDLQGRLLDPIPFVNISRIEILKLINFAKNTSLPLIFGLNLLYRTNSVSNSWNPDNAQNIWNFMKNENFVPRGWEVGNEPDRYPHHNIRNVGASKIARDLVTLRKEVRRFWGKQPWVIGPDVTRPTKSHRFLEKYFNTLLIKNKTVDKFTFHHYYFDGAKASVEDFMNITIMDSLKNEILTADRIRKQYKQDRAALWIGETASGYGGGVANISNSFASSFLYLDKLGLAAQLGVKVIFRQTLYSKTSWYGLINRNGDPTPDYYLTLIFKRLVGQKVLDPHSYINNLIRFPELRIYSHCSKPENGSVVLFGMNLSNRTISLKIPGAIDSIIYEYKLTPGSRNITSIEMYMNNNLIQLTRNHTLPDLSPNEKQKVIKFEGNTIGFWIFPLAKVKACFRKK